MKRFKLSIKQTRLFLLQSLVQQRLLIDNGLFYKLIGKISDSIWRILFKYYECSSGILKINGEKSDEFDINQGVKQGGVYLQLYLTSSSII
jgi:hypothetical protein